MQHKDTEDAKAELAKKLGAATRRLREERGTSLEDLAARAEIDKGWLGKMERETGATTSIYGWFRIAKAFGLTLGEFFTVALKLRRT
jgi:transcriptional regulator with XRE-family HTH domain